MMDLTKQMYLNGSITIDTVKRKLQLSMSTQHEVNTLPRTTMDVVFDLTTNDHFLSRFGSMLVAARMEPTCDCMSKPKKLKIPGVNNNECECNSTVFVIELYEQKGFSSSNNVRLVFALDDISKDSILVTHSYNTHIGKYYLDEDKGSSKYINTDYITLKKGQVQYRYTCNQMNTITILFESRVIEDTLDATYKTEDDESVTIDKTIPIIYTYSNLYRWKEGKTDMVGYVNDAIIISEIEDDKYTNKPSMRLITQTASQIKDEDIKEVKEDE